MFLVSIMKLSDDYIIFKQNEFMNGMKKQWICRHSTGIVILILARNHDTTVSFIGEPKKDIFLTTIYKNIHVDLATWSHIQIMGCLNRSLKSTISLIFSGSIL